MVRLLRRGDNIDGGEKAIGHLRRNGGETVGEEDIPGVAAGYREVREGRSSVIGQLMRKEVRSE